jgi:hypothetical protein
MIGEHAGEEPSMVLGRTTADGRWREQGRDALPAVVGQLDERPGESVGSGAVQVGWMGAFPPSAMTLLGDRLMSATEC